MNNIKVRLFKYEFRWDGVRTTFGASGLCMQRWNRDAVVWSPVITVALALSRRIAFADEWWTRWLFPEPFIFFLFVTCACPISFGHLQGVSSAPRPLVSFVNLASSTHGRPKKTGIDRASSYLLAHLSSHKMPTGVSPGQSHRSTRRIVSLVCAQQLPHFDPYFFLFIVSFLFFKSRIDVSTTSGSIVDPVLRSRNTEEWR